MTDLPHQKRFFEILYNRLNTAYGFDFLYAPALNTETVDNAVAAWSDAPGVGWPSWAFENHDAPRAVSRWLAPPGHEHAFAACKMALLMCLRGNVFLYNGEELALTQVDVPFEDLQDPEAIANWPMTLSRDGARTPMPWIADAPHCGFSTAKPWLPLGRDHQALAVDRQEGDAASILHLTRRLVALRRAHPALMTGRWRALEVGPALLAFEREAVGETMLCVFNLGVELIAWRPAEPDGWRVVEAINGAADWTLPAYGALIAERG